MWFLLACGVQGEDGGDAHLLLANCTGWMDFDAGLDEALEGRWEFHYNRLGEPEEALYDIGADGTDNSRMSYLYSGDLLMERDWDGGNTGQIDRRSFYSYDAQNRLEEERIEADGTLSDRITYVYGSGTEITYRYHWKADGSLFETGSFKWEDGLKIGVIWKTERSDSLVQYRYEGRLLATEETHEGTSAKINQREISLWDEEGRKAQVDKDMNADGTPDYRSIWRYECP